MYEDVVKELRNLLRAYKATDNGNCHQAQILANAADAIEELEYKYKKALGDLVKQTWPKWLPVAERLPEISVPVLAYVYWPEYQDTMICYGTRKKTRWFLTHCEEGELLRGYEVTHWAPLPEPPKEET